jgi:hypothetical protein
MSSLSEYLNEKGYTELEGNSNQVPGQINLLHLLSLKAKHILEIGLMLVTLQKFFYKPIQNQKL